MPGSANSESRLLCDQPDGVFCIYSCPVDVSLRERFLDHPLLLLLLLLRLLGEARQLLRTELQLEQCLLHASIRPKHFLWKYIQKSSNILGHNKIKYEHFHQKNTYTKINLLTMSVLHTAVRFKHFQPFRKISNFSLKASFRYVAESDIGSIQISAH